MIESRDDVFLWVEKYRPQTIDECVLPESLKKTFKEYVAKGQLPTFLFCGTAGVGKTTIAKALCNEVGADWIIINGSDEGRSIDTLRTTIKNFASTVSLTEAKKVVIIDEADYMNADSVQPALRNFMEEYSKNCGFILTCNFPEKIIEPLHSRCTEIEFKINKSESVKLAKEFLNRLKMILDSEGVTYDVKVLAEFIMLHFPDWRKVLNELQGYGITGTIDSGILKKTAEGEIDELVKFLKNKDFTSMRKWVPKTDISFESLSRKLYDKAYDIIDKNSIPQLVIILADYGYKSAFCKDEEINTVAMLTEIMGEILFL